MSKHYDVYMGFSSGNSWYSAMIRWFLWAGSFGMSSKISHVWLSVRLSPHVRMVLGANERGITWEYNKRFLDKNRVYATIKPVGPSLDEAFEKFLEDHSDAGYDYIEAGSVGMKNKFPWLWRIFKKPLEKGMSDEKFSCHEVLIEILQHAGYTPIIEAHKKERLNAQTLMDLILSLKHKEWFEISWVDDSVAKSYGVTK